MDTQAPGLSFFTCQQHFPQAFWNEAPQRHPNGATAITGVTIAAPRPKDHAGFLSAFTGSPVAEPTHMPLDGGAISLIPGIAAPAFVGLDVQVPDLESLAERLRALCIALAERAGRRTVDPDVLYGVELSFAC